MTKPLLSMKCPRGMKMRDYLAALKYPLGATPKIDGIRARTVPPTAEQYALSLALGIRQHSDARTRSNKTIPCLHIRGLMESLPPFLDGELTCGDTFQAVTSGVMAISGTPEFTYWAFDYQWQLSLPYWDRVQRLKSLAEGSLPPWCKILAPRLVSSLKELLEYENECLGGGAEGVMLRPMDSPYDTGYSDNRATAKRPFLVAIKRFEDGEAEILDFVEAEENFAAVEVNQMGLNFRPSRQATLRPKGTLGALEVKDLETGAEFRLGTGFTQQQRAHIWNNKAEYLKKAVKYKWQAHGTKDKPRIPVFLGFRAEEDMP